MIKQHTSTYKTSKAMASIVFHLVKIRFITFLHFALSHAPIVRQFATTSDTQFLELCQSLETTFIRTLVPDGLFPGKKTNQLSWEKET